MLIGLSLSRCVADIMNDKVNEKDVGFIVARTDFDPMKGKDTEAIWKGYTEPNAWSDYHIWQPFVERKAELLGLVVQLHRQAKLIQPRRTGQWPGRMPEGRHWMKMVQPGVYDELIEESNTLRKLEAAGVRDWEGFEHAMS